MRNGVTHEVIVDAIAPASLTRAYRSTVEWKGNTYMQMTAPLSNNWVKISETNQEIFSIKVRLTKEQYSSLQTSPIPITPAMLGLSEDETAKILQDETVWRLEPNGDEFKP